MFARIGSTTRYAKTSTLNHKGTALEMKTMSREKYSVASNALAALPIEHLLPKGRLERILKNYMRGTGVCSKSTVSVKQRK